VANVELSSPRWWKTLNPPSFPPLVKTPVSCGNLPVNIDDCDGQQSESVTE
jgi:hypothetical protein